MIIAKTVTRGNVGMMGSGCMADEYYDGVLTIREDVKTVDDSEIVLTMVPKRKKGVLLEIRIDPKSFSESLVGGWSRHCQYRVDG